MLCAQVMSNTTYRQTAQAIASAMQHYAAQRHPYQRAADEVELAVLTRRVTAAAAGCAAGGSPSHKCPGGVVAASTTEAGQQQAEHGEL
jgi:hypothetical protein